MSLTSYRAAPSRVKVENTLKRCALKRPIGGSALSRFTAFCRPGGDLLSHTLRCSTIGAGEFHGRVRDGIGWGLPAEATRPAKRSLCCRKTG